MGQWNIFFSKNLQASSWNSNSTSSISVGMANLLSTKAQGVFWLHLQDTNTRGLLKRKKYAATCELRLLQREERLMHLFFKYLFAKNCWLSIGVQVPT
jgi:hypothetical protein